MTLPVARPMSERVPEGPYMRALNEINALRQGYANTALTQQKAQWLPYQYQMQALSNPLLWLAAEKNPQLKQQLTQMLSNPMQLMGASAGQQNQSQNNVFERLLGKIGAGSSSPNAINAMPGANFGNTQTPGTNAVNVPPGPNSGSSMVPGSGLEGYTQKMTAPYEESQRKPGVPYRDPKTGNIISPATDATVTAQQSAINAEKRAEPQLKRLATLMGPFLSAKGQMSLRGEQGLNFLFPQRGGKLPTQYAEAKALIKSLPESLVKTYSLYPTNENIERMEQIITPVTGETSKQYEDRMKKQLRSLQDEQVGISQQQLSEGFNLSEGAPQNLPPVEQGMPTLEGRSTLSDEDIRTLEQNHKAKTTKPLKSLEFKSAPSQKDIRHTASIYGITEDEVRKKLGLK